MLVGRVKTIYQDDRDQSLSNSENMCDVFPFI